MNWMLARLCIAIACAMVTSFAAPQQQPWQSESGFRWKQLEVPPQGKQVSLS